MKRRLFCLLAAVALLLPTGADAAFKPSKTYQNQFRDVPASAWYARHVETLYELGLTVGQGSTDTFAPDAQITLAEVAAMCARLRSLYETGSSEAGPAAFTGAEAPWYSRYTAYLRSLHIIGGEFDGQFDSPASRAQMAHLLAAVLPETEFSPINAEAVALGYASRSYITDVDAYTLYQQDILTLYRWGILNGVDSTGSFHPADAISRCQVAAMVTRLADPALRITLDWHAGLSNREITMESLVSSDGTFHAAPAAGDAAAIDDNIRCMLSRGERRMILSYPPNTLKQEDARQLMNAFLTCVSRYPEQTYNTVSCSYSAQTGSVVLVFSSSLYSERLIDSCRQTILEQAVALRQQLWSEGAITAGSTQRQKALAYYTRLCQRCVYDSTAGDDSISHSAYGAFVNGRAVCDGYTAAYNLLLKLEGIECSAVSTGDHIWTSAVLDGTPCHIDLTWGDREASISYDYFAMTEAASMARFS